MTLQQLRYAIAIADAGSFNKAAERLYVAQPSLTSAIRELEKELGIMIFNRSGRGVTLTQDGAEFMLNARQLYAGYEDLRSKYSDGAHLKKKFGVSTQHYSFAVRAFVNTVRKIGTTDYEFAIRETKTRDVISDVATFRSEIGILYMSDFNRSAIRKLLKTNRLVFHHLIDCKPYVYLWRGHPLADKESIRFSELEEYPCLAFEQGDDSSFYFAEEVLSTEEYRHIIRACDRATMLNLMRGLNGYTLCSGIICEELNGSDYIAVPFEADSAEGASEMDIGYITKKNYNLSTIGRLYVEALEDYLK